VGLDVIGFETRDDDLDTAKLVTAATLGPLDPLSAQAQLGAAGCAPGDSQPDRAIQGRNIDLRTEHGLAQGQRQRQLDVVPVAAQVGIWLHHDVQVEIARLA
jgi:hypothetical protein